MKSVTLYCDGSALGNPGAGGWCGILEYKGTKKVLSGGEAHTTNNRMELLAVIQSLKALKEPCKIELYSDSKYVCEGINTWLKNWVAKDFAKVKNPDLWREYLKVSKGHFVSAHWIKGHAGIPLNEECDSIAKAQAQKFLS
ncbi:ribonuclease HI [Helicobacter sp. MIT 00-7814]|uniref:ribonuclease HI n=1 Tax=unclassified Helicobacter TaxID=2593540 RepID=UPI000E1EAEFE|nr:MULTISPECIES: ribonuclease HI [unclassified Helicobacter]RDU54793.1 ribonuclease HI [Helicobacter sp. MIT 99-10781]RDU54851.1 ribonuclease HI [Helicobacter sp. MIT 00-7814]